MKAFLYFQKEAAELSFKIDHIIIKKTKSVILNWNKTRDKESPKDYINFKAGWKKAG